LTELKEAMYEKMAYLVLSEGRPFYYGDFLLFDVDGSRYKPTYGTIRNIFSEFRKEGKIKVNCNSKPVFYELIDSNLTRKSMTHTHMGGILTVISNNNPFYTKLKTLPMDKHSIHDIRLRCTVPNIYEALAINTKYPIRDYSRDIELPYWNIDNATIQIRMHKTNTVSVVLACSQEPFPLDISGITAFFTTLGQVRGSLVGTMLSIYNQDINLIQKRVPPLSDWLITMWHFGRDSLIEVSKKEYHETVENAEHIIERFYTKDLNGNHRLRHEILEYPNKPVFDAMNEKLELINPNSNNSS